MRHAISVFESAFNLMCDVEEGCAPLSTDFPHGGPREITRLALVVCVCL